MSLLLLLVGCVALLLALMKFYQRFGLQRSRCYPPGPPGHFLLGNLRDMPSKYAWETFSDWGRKYGPISYLCVMGQPILVINSQEVAIDLLDKRASIYSDRPRFVMAKLSGYSGTSVLLPHGATHKMARKLFAQVLHPHIVERDFAPVQGRLMLQLVKALIEDPDNHKRHIRRSIAEVLQAITYGNCSDDDGTDLVDLNNNAVMNLGKALTGYTVDILPWLKYIPEWIPGTQFHRDARAFREFMELALSQPLNMVKRQVADGTAPPSFVSSLLEADEDERSSDDFIAWAGFSMFGGGSDTTVATLETFMLAMTLYPDVQSKARQELDSVVRGRLPTISDKDSTPYLNAVILETLRWHPVVPAGVPHRLMRDDFYKGYSIPAGTIVFVNAWGILHDEHQFPDPFTFDPSRFLSETTTINGSETAPLNPRSVGFGYGTRSCQGIAVVESALWIAMSTILYSLEIRKKVDPQTGQAIVPNVQWEGDAISPPKAFVCDIVPRSQERTGQVMAAVADNSKGCD